MTYAYDLLSRATNRWSEAKGYTKYIYDKRDGLTKVDYPTSNDITLQYDALGRTTNMVDAVGTSVYSYSSGLLTAEDGPWASDTVTISHNGSGLRSQVAIAQPTGSAWTNSYSYDAGHRLTSVTSPAGAYGYQFSGAGTLVTRLDQPNGFWVTNSYDSRARMIDTRLYDNAGVLLNQHWYAMNHAHQRTTVTNFNYASTNFNRKFDYTYDNAGEVRTARAYYGGGAAVAADSLDFGYDAGWNIQKRTNNATVTAYTINSLNQVSADGAGSWTNDANGNLTFRPRSGGNNLSYTYDDENQLATVASTSEWKMEFSYDGRGRMRVRKDYTWSGGSWALSRERRYVYDGMLIVQERSSSNNPEITYTRGTDLSGGLEGAGGIGGLLSRGVHSGTSPYDFSSAAHYHADGSGNVTMLVGTGTPTIKAYYRYDVFGLTLASGGALADDNAMRFSSKPVMGSSALYYYGFRFYDPSSERWLNRDPLEEEGGINLYAMVRNSPVDTVDPDGYSFFSYVRPGPRFNPRRGPPFRPNRNVFVIEWVRPYSPQQAMAIARACAIQRAIDAARRQAVDTAWKMEREMVRRTGKGTVNWNEDQVRELMDTCRVSGYEGHHRTSVSIAPQIAHDPSNIQFVTRLEHFELHNFNWAIPRRDPPINRTPWIK